MSLNHAYCTEAEYLTGEQFSTIKHEYIHGDVYAIAGASRNHERISRNILTLFTNHLKDLSCEPFASDMKVKADGCYFYPDVLVVFDDEQGDDYYTEKTTINIEVLSKATRRNDKTIKMQTYKTLPSLQKYVLIEQDYVDIEICRRTNAWVSEHYFLVDDITFNALDLTVPVADIYARVNNEDMTEYLKKLAESK